MASIFCSSCGSKSEYKFAAPNFCYKCGNPYSRSSNFLHSSKTFKSEPSIDSEMEGEDYEDEDFGEDFSNSTRVPRISKLHVEIDSSTDVKVVKFEDILNSNSNSSFKRPKNLDLDNI